MKRFYGAWWGRLFLLILMVVGTAQIFCGRSVFLIDGVNLVFHEAGHVIFYFFGQFLSVLGGTFLQLLIPAFAGSVFYWRYKIFAASFSLWWLGTNLIGVSSYMADSRLRRLELIGDLHDWAYLFGQTGLSSYDTAIASFVWAVGIIAVVGGVIFCGVVLWRQRVVGHFHRNE